MYTKDYKVLDYREVLKIKLKSLAHEATIIRKEEQKLKRFHRSQNERTQTEVFPNGNVIRSDLRAHRVFVVREEARHTVLAYGFIRGRTYESMEAKCFTKPNWEKVRRLIKKYGPVDFVEPACMKDGSVKK